VIKVGSYDLGKSTTLESNKSHSPYTGILRDEWAYDIHHGTLPPSRRLHTDNSTVRVAGPPEDGLNIAYRFAEDLLKIGRAWHPGEGGSLPP